MCSPSPAEGSVWPSVRIKPLSQMVTALFLCRLYLADLRGVLQQLAGVEAIPVLDEVVPQAAVRQVLHDEPQVPASCTVEKHRSCIIVGIGDSPQKPQRNCPKELFYPQK